LNTINLQISLPDDVFNALTKQSPEFKLSDFVIEAIKLKFQKNNTSLNEILREGYEATANEDAQILKNFSGTDFEHWDWLREKGDIFWANLDPVIGSEISKTRPVLIVSNDLNNTYSDTITILPITTSTHKIYPFEVYITNEESGLINDSKIKANQIRTIDKQRLYKKISELSKEKMYDVEKAVLIHLSIKI
jgi:mRNA interferase MazF